ncbi:MAG: hypothetical protein KatS3mg090_0787 [Patescibacteria group bacterium]|nr:MAG: hypothetical protein KatS3mg090_0787 [Patescibacteria group bacterium]
MRVTPQIKSEIKKLLLKKLNESKNKAVVYTAVKLTQDEIKSLEKAIPELEHKQIEQIVDNSIISGFKVVIGTTVYDFTVNSKLSSLKRLNI